MQDTGRTETTGHASHIGGAGPYPRSAVGSAGDDLRQSLLVFIPSGRDDRRHSDRTALRLHGVNIAAVVSSQFLCHVT